MFETKQILYNKKRNLFDFDQRISKQENQRNRNDFQRKEKETLIELDERLNERSLRNTTTKDTR